MLDGLRQGRQFRLMMLSGPAELQRLDGNGRSSSRRRPLAAIQRPELTLTISLLATLAPCH